MFLKSGISAILVTFSIMLLVFFGLESALASEEPIAFEADNVVVNKTDGSLLATGNVVLKQSGNTLKADEITYNKKSGRAVARGNVVHTDFNGTVTRAMVMEVEKKFTHIVAETLITRFISGDWMAADNADRKTGDMTTFESSRFTPCNCDFLNGERPLWDIRASQSVHNEKTKTITHYNLRMHVMNVPVFYLPYLSHPDSTVKRRSGFLTPSFLISSDVGFTPSIPYFYVIDDNSDLEFKIYKYQYRGAAAKTRYRRLWNKSDLQADIYTAHVETYKHDRETVGAIDASFYSEIGDNWDVNAKLLRSSQDTFLRRYNFIDETSLKSSVTAERLFSDRYYYVEASDRQSLTTTNDNTNEPTILPHIFYEKIKQGWRPNQQLRTELSALQLDNDEDNDYARWSGVFEVSEDFVMQKGIGNYAANLTTNYYEIHSRESTANTKLGTVVQAHPSLSLGWRMPVGITGFGRTGIIEPKVQFTHVAGNDQTNDIPNRDASDYRIDEANLFLPHRYQGKDYILPGARADLGVAVNANDNFFGNIAAFTGISRRLSGKPSAGLNTNQDDLYSDYVGSLAMNPAGLFKLRWSGRISSHDFTLNESKTVVTNEFESGSLSLTHSQLSKSYFSNSKDDREELSAIYRQKIGENWSFVASEIWDLSYDTTLREKRTAALSWSGGPQDCLTLTINYINEPNTDRDIDAVDQVNLVVSLKQLGAVSKEAFDSLTNGE